MSDHLVRTSNGVQLRRIVYTNPEEGVSDSYLTNDFTLPAYQLVLLYKHRWDIEKIFHQLKSKMHERKSWASSLEAKEAHAVFECIAHNLLVHFEQRIVDEEVLCDEVEQNRQIGRTRENPDDIAPVNDERNFINSAVTRATQRTQRFIRWIRVRIYQQAPWSESNVRLRALWLLPT